MTEQERIEILTEDIQAGYFREYELEEKLLAAQQDIMCLKGTVALLKQQIKRKKIH